MVAENLYDLISGDEDARVCKDISDEACTCVPTNFFLQLAAQIATKLGDALSDPKLVLVWLLQSIGAPAAAIGLLVPVREAGSLIPQLAIGGAIRGYPVRKGWWVAGSVAQGLAVLAIALLAFLQPGDWVGWAVVGLMAAFSVARAVCSISSKDLVGKTVPRTRRGRLGGLSATAAGLITLAVGLTFAFLDPDDLGPGVLAGLLCVAGGLWFVAAVLMSRLREQPGATSGSGNALTEAIRSLRYLVDDKDFRNFCAARGLLAGLGILLVAKSGSEALSATVWGWMADRSSRVTLAIAGMCAGAVGVLTFMVAGFDITGTAALWTYGALFFLIGLAHTGIRIGRKTYLVDMAPADRRASYVAVSNILIGVVLLAFGAVGLLTPLLGARGVVLLFSTLGLAGGLLAWTMRRAGDPTGE